MFVGISYTESYYYWAHNSEWSTSITITIVFLCACQRHWSIIKYLTLLILVDRIFISHHTHTDWKVNLHSLQCAVKIQSKIQFWILLLQSLCLRFTDHNNHILSNKNQKMTYINRNVCSVAAVAAAVALYGDYCIKERHTCILLLNTKILSSHHNYYGDYNQTSEIFQLKLMTNDCVYSEYRNRKWKNHTYIVVHYWY